MPRQQRRRQRLARGALLLALLLGGLGTAGYVAADRFFGDDGGENERGVPAAVSTPPAVAQAPAATPPPAPTATSRASVAQRVPTATPAGAAAAPTATAPPTEATRPPRRAARETAAEADAAQEAAGEPTAIEDLLPTADEAPADLTQATNPTERAIDEVITSLGSPDAVERLEALGWEANYTVQFTAPNPDVLPAGSTTAIDISIHRLADGASAAEALTYFSDQLVAALGFEEFRVDPIGDEVRALRGVNDQGVAQVVLYVQIGADLARISGTANTEDGDPTTDVVAAAEAVVARAE